MSKYAPDKNLVGIYVLDEILTTFTIMEVRQLRYDIGQKGNDRKIGPKIQDDPYKGPYS